MGLKSQCIARRARSHFNECLTSVTHDMGATLFDMMALRPPSAKAFLIPAIQGDLTDVSLSMFLADIVLLIREVHKPFQVAQETRQLLFHMSEALRLQ